MNMNSIGCQRASWNELPLVVVGHVYEYLDFKDRINASSTCKHWRNCLFQKRFFKDFRTCIQVNDKAHLKFFHQRLCYLAKELVIVFDILQFPHIERIKHLLYKLVRCDNIRAVRFRTDNVGLIVPPESEEESPVNAEKCFVEPLKAFLNRESGPCHLLDLGAIEALTSYGSDFIKALRRPKELLQLTLASIKYDPSNYSIFSIDATLFQKCASLQVLSLDYDILNDEVLHTIQQLPLTKLLIVVHGLDLHYQGISETAWTSFSAHFQNIDLILTLMYAYEAIEVLQVRLLRRNMPISHLRVLFCDFMNTDALNWMSIHNSETLRSVHYIDSAYKHSSKDYREMFMQGGQDPFVMMCWRCKKLEDIVIHGYVIEPLNVLGMARLRGRQLKHLEISMIDYTSGVSLDSFSEEICTLLGREWAPLDDRNMHPSLGYSPSNDDIRDEYIFNRLRMDLA